MPQKKEPSENYLDWDDRILCSDESCIGIVGRDGKCKECGKVFDGNLPEDLIGSPDNQTSEPTLEKHDEDNLLESEKTENSEKGVLEPNEDDLELDWEKRILCSDENCIGIIDSDGKCKECGKPYAENK